MLSNWNLCGQDNKVLSTTERLIAFALLVEAYSSQKPASNPFISFIVNVNTYYCRFTCWNFFVWLFDLSNSLKLEPVFEG